MMDDRERLSLHSPMVICSRILHKVCRPGCTLMYDWSCVTHSFSCHSPVAAQAASQRSDPCNLPLSRTSSRSVGLLAGSRAAATSGALCLVVRCSSLCFCAIFIVNIVETMLVALFVNPVLFDWTVHRISALYSSHNSALLTGS